jgi:hypothetical protein
MCRPTEVFFTPFSVADSSADGSVEAGDLDLDGRTDLMYSNRGVEDLDGTGLYYQVLRWLLARANGTYSVHTLLLLQDAGCELIRLVDLDGDGDLDLLCSNKLFAVGRDAEGNLIYDGNPSRNYLSWFQNSRGEPGSPLDNPTSWFTTSRRFPIYAEGAWNVWCVEPLGRAVWEQLQFCTCRT